MSGHAMPYQQRHERTLAALPDEQRDSALRRRHAVPMAGALDRASAEALASTVRAATEHAVEVHSEGDRFVVHVVTGDGTFYLRSSADWAMTRRVANHSADGPTTAKNRLLAHRTSRAMNRGVRNAVRALKPQGVIGAIPFLSYYVEPVVWLVVDLDVDRDRLIEDEAVRDAVLRELRKSGVREDLLREAGVTVESQETVDRDFDGSWWFAMK